MPTQILQISRHLNTLILNYFHLKLFQFLNILFG